MHQCNYVHHRIPIKLKTEPKPRYNYDNYLYDLKESMQVSPKIARKQLIENKIKSKRGIIETRILQKYM